MKFYNKLASTSLLFVASISTALAAPVDLTSLMAGVDFSTTTAAVLAVSVLLIGVYIALKASSIVEKKVRGG